MDERCRVTPGGGDPRESATESKPPAFLIFGGYRGKAPKGPPRATFAEGVKAGKGERVG